MGSFGYHIKLKRISPPDGENEWAATVELTFRDLDQAQARRISDQVGEVQGQTEEETIERMRVKLRDWMKTNGDSLTA